MCMVRNGITAKLIAIILLLELCLSMVGCTPDVQPSVPNPGGYETPDDTEQPDGTEPSQVKAV